MWIFTCPSCGGYLAHDYNIEDRMTCTHCFAVYSIIISLAATDNTLSTTKSPKENNRHG